MLKLVVLLSVFSLAHGHVDRILNHDESAPHNTSSVTTRAVKEFAVDIASAGVAAIVSKTAMAPLERVKVLLQVQTDSDTVIKPYSGISDAVLSVVREEGVLGLWRGNLVNVVRYFAQQSLNFAFKNFYKTAIYQFEGHNSTEVHVARSMQADLVINLFAGAAAGATSLLITYPLDFIRTRLAADVADNGFRDFEGPIDCFVKIVKSDGIPGMYRGFFMAVQGIAIYRAAYFGLYDTAKTVIEQQGYAINFFASWAVAQVVTVIASFVTYPFDTIRRRMMMQSGRKELVYSGSCDCLKKIVLNEGITGLFKGGLCNMIRCTGGALVMAIYQEIHKFI